MSRPAHRRTSHASRPRRRLTGLSIVLAVVVGLSGVAAAYVTITGTGTAQSKAGTIGAATGFTASAVHYTKAKLSWTAPSGYTPTSVTLSQSPGTLHGCAATSPTSGCTATTLTPFTTYTWTLTYHYHNWSAVTTLTQQTLAHILMVNPTCTIDITGANTHTVVTGCSITAEGTANSIKLYRPTLPASQTGDVLIAQFGARRGTATGLTGPAGWTKITSASSTGTGVTNFVATYYCVVTATSACKKTGATTWTWSWTSSGGTPPTSYNASGGIIAFTGVTPTTPVNAGSKVKAAASKWTKATLPAVTPTQYDSQVLSFIDSGGTQVFHSGGTCKIASGTVKKHYTNRNTNTAHKTYIHDSAVCVPTAVQATKTVASSAMTFTLSAAGTNTYAWVATTAALNPK